MKKMKLDIQLFNGSVAIQTITETTDINTNASTFTIPAKMTTTGATYNNSNASMTLQWKYASASSWTTISKQTFKIGKNSSVTKNWTLSLTHNADGTLENVQFRVQWYITDSTNGTTGATTFTPTTIPRASIPTLSSSSVNMGSSVTIYTNRYSSSFTHTIRYAFGNANGTIASYVATSIIWTPSLTLANQIPSSTSGVGTIYCDTYNGSTLIGTKTINITLNVPSSIVPSTSFTQVQEAGSVPSSWGIYVKSKSKVALAISGSGSYGSSISSYKISYYGGAVTTSSATTSFLTQSGSTTFTGQVTDTRGRSASTTTSINVVDYSNPTISTAQVQRCDANGNIDNNGEYMYISYGASISSCSSKNTPSAVYKVGYRVHNTGSYTYVSLTTNANSYSASGVLFTNGIKAASSSGTKVQFSTNNTYDIQFYVKDYFMEYTNVQSLDAGFDLLNFNPSGKAMAIGKVSEAGANEELLEIGMNTKVDGTLSVNNSGIEIYNNNPYVDWHFNNSTDNYTSRLIEWSSGVLTYEGGTFQVSKRLQIPSSYDNSYGIINDNNKNLLQTYDNHTIINGAGNDIVIGSIQDTTRFIALHRPLVGRQLNNGAGTNGYMFIGTFKIVSTYMNQPIEVEILQRNRSGTIYIQFGGGNSTDPSLNRFQIDGNISAYMFRTTTSTWKLWVYKSESYDNIDVKIKMGSYSSGIQFAWGNATETSLPSGYISATPIGMGSMFRRMSVSQSVSTKKVVFTFADLTPDFFMWFSFRSNSNYFGGTFLINVGYGASVVNAQVHNDSGYSYTISGNTNNGVVLTINENNIASGDTFKVKAVRTLGSLEDY